jgi:hypothetical protein
VHNITDARPRTDGSSALAPHQDAQGGEQEPPVTVFEMQVAVEVQKIKVREEAARRLRRERVDASPPTVSLLSDFLAIEDDPVAYRIHDLLPQGGRAVLAAQFKAGKTTIIGNLIRSLVDGDRFLGHFDVEPVTGRVVVLDDELDERMLRRWLRDQGIRNTDRVVVVPLRGKVSSFDILDPQGRAEWSALLAAAEAEIVILDCLAPALDALGLSEDKEAGRFLVAFDELLKTSGTSEAIVVHHMGHSGERSRGASRLRDWPDVEWRLVRDKSDGEDDPDARRYFSAYGRDVNVPEAGIEYDAITRHLSISDPFSGAADNRKAAKVMTKVAELKVAILQHVTDHPGVKASDLWVAIGTKQERGGRVARDALVEEGLIKVSTQGRSEMHFPTGM